MNISTVDIVLWYNYNMNSLKAQERTTIKIWDDSRKLLKIIAALSDTSVVAVIHRLAEQEYERLQKEQYHRSTGRV
jgi:hypothetical protein